MCNLEENQQNPFQGLGGWLCRRRLRAKAYSSSYYHDYYYRLSLLCFQYHSYQYDYLCKILILLLLFFSLYGILVIQYYYIVMLRILILIWAHTPKVLNIVCTQCNLAPS